MIEYADFADVIMKGNVRRCVAFCLLCAPACGGPEQPRCPEGAPEGRYEPAPVEAPPVAPAAEPTPAPAPGEPRARPAGTVYAITFGEHELVVDPADGARTIAFTLAGKNILRERVDNPDAYGSSFWTSPQSDWGWPPPPELAGKPWQAELQKDAIVLRSKPLPKLGFEVTQKVSVDTAKAFASFEYTIKNGGSAPKKVAAWQNTRVAPGGLTLYPSGGPLRADSTLKFDSSKEVAFFKHDPKDFKNGVKSFGDGKEGWLAHVDGDLVLIKVFPDVPPEQQAPKEAEIELYVDGGGTFVEVEQQGPYVEIAPGASSSWLVKWYLRKLPAGVKAEPGNKELVEFIRGAIR